MHNVALSRSRNKRRWHSCAPAGTDVVQHKRCSQHMIVILVYVGLRAARVPRTSGTGLTYPSVRLTLGARPPCPASTLARSGDSSSLPTRLAHRFARARFWVQQRTPSPPKAERGSSLELAASYSPLARRVIAALGCVGLRATRSTYLSVRLTRGARPPCPASTLTRSKDVCSHPAGARRRFARLACGYNKRPPLRLKQRGGPV